MCTFSITVVVKDLERQEIEWSLCFPLFCIKGKCWWLRLGVEKYFHMKKNISRVGEILEEIKICFFFFFFDK
jgi:hypothetical protein